MKKRVYEKPKVNNPFYDRECPEWFSDAKLGIFIHWGPYAVPGWAPLTEGAVPYMTRLVMEAGYDVDSVHDATDVLSDVIKMHMSNGNMQIIEDITRLSAENPYAEWYWNSLGVGNATAQYHEETYGDKPYTDFGKEFKEATELWEPDKWVELFEKIGAKYVITTAKHHDGFCLYPSRYKNPNIDNWQSERDLMGELQESVLEADMKFALYYSAGIDWSLSGVPIKGSEILQDEEAINYFDKQLLEIIERYKPSLIWEDIGYPEKGDFNKILEQYYKTVPDGVVNDRAQPALGARPSRHFDYTTTEYFVPLSIREVPWEVCRGLSNSFAYNRADNGNTILSANELVASLADIISKNGNLLIGIGPMADGTIPQNQISVVTEFGEWVSANGEAIYGTRPYIRFDDVASCGNDIRFTTKDEYLYAIILGEIPNEFSFSKLKLKEGIEFEILENRYKGIVRSGKLAIPKGVANAGLTIKILTQDILDVNRD